MFDLWANIDPWTCPKHVLLAAMYEMSWEDPRAEEWERARKARTFEENRHPSRDSNCIR